MKMANGFGSVYKLSGNRRNPWAARITVGWKVVPDKMKAHPQYKFLGFYPTKSAALTALVDYNKDPYDYTLSVLTFSEVYDKWSAGHFEKVSQSNINGTKAAYRLCEPIYNMKLKDIKLEHLQRIVDDSGKNYPTLRKLKVLFGLVFDYAVKHEIIKPERRELVRYVDISSADNPNGFDRSPFTRDEISLLWDNKASNPYMTTFLMLIYTGLRIGELLDLKKEDVHLNERYFFVRYSKTSSGVREVPIAEKLVQFFEYWLSQNSEYLICTDTGKRMLYRNYYDTIWKPLMEKLDMKHRPHDGRHTCVSLLVAAGVDDRIIKKIVGHKGQGVTETVYTHLDLKTKLEAINKI